MDKKIVSRCPFCNDELVVGRLICSGCKTQIDTSLPIPTFFRLPQDLQDFALSFLRCRGNIREMEKLLGISYPTVSKKLDLVNEILGNQTSPRLSPKEILEMVERGEITAKEAAQMLKGGQ